MRPGKFILLFFLAWLLFFGVGAAASGFGLLFLSLLSFSIVLLLCFAGLELVLFFYFSKKYGKRPEGTAGYVRDIPYDYGPAIASFILDLHLKEDDITATFLDLVRRKYFKIEEVGHKKHMKIFGRERDYLITKMKMKSKLVFKEVEGKQSTELIPEGLKPYEEVVYRLYTEQMDKESIKMSQLALKVYLNPEYETFLEDWRKIVEGEVRKLKLVSYIGLERFVYWTKILFVFNFVFVFFSFIPTIGFSIFSLFFTALAYGTLVSKYKKYLISYTELGAEHYLKWAGLRRFMKEFSTLGEKTPKFLAIWDRYLIYATAFGLGKEVENYISLSLPGRYRDRSALGVLGKPYAELSITAWVERLNMLGSNLERVQKMLDIGEAALRKAELAQRKAQQKPRKIA